MPQLMANPKNKKPGRPFSDGETTEKQMQIRLTPSQWKALEEKRGDLPRSTYLKRLLAQAPSETMQPNEPIEVVGRICAGDGFGIQPVPDGVTVIPPFAVPMGAYALSVVGHSMTRPDGRGSVPDGSLAIFRPDKFAASGSIVHVEWDCGEQRCAAIKKLVEDEHGERHLVSLNPDYDDLPHFDECELKGVFYRAIINEAAASQTASEQIASNALSFQEQAQRRQAQRQQKQSQQQQQQDEAAA